MVSFEYIDFCQKSCFLGPTIFKTPLSYFVNMSNKNPSFTIPDSAYPSGSDLNGSGGAGSNVNTNKGQEIEYWAHQHQWFETGKLTTATDSTASNSENLIPTFKKEANTSLITSAGQTVYLHCHVENLGERSVRTLFLKFKYSEKATFFL